MTDSRRLIRELSDAHGRKMDVYADQGGVTIDLGLSDRNLTIADALQLATVIAAAAWRATAHQAARDAR